MKTPSFRRQGLRCRTMTAGRTFLRRSGFPFLTVAMTISPTQADGRRFRRPLIPLTEMMYRFFAPVLSAQFTVAATGRPSDMRNLFPAEPPLPRFDIFASSLSSLSIKASRLRKFLIYLSWSRVLALCCSYGVVLVWSVKRCRFDFFNFPLLRLIDKIVTFFLWSLTRYPQYFCAQIFFFF